MKMQNEPQALTARIKNFEQQGFIVANVHSYRLYEGHTAFNVLMVERNQKPGYGRKMVLIELSADDETGKVDYADVTSNSIDHLEHMVQEARAWESLLTCGVQEGA